MNDNLQIDLAIYVIIFIIIVLFISFLLWKYIVWLNNKMGKLGLKIYHKIKDK